MKNNFKKNVLICCFILLFHFGRAQNKPSDVCYDGSSKADPVEICQCYLEAGEVSSEVISSMFHYIILGSNHKVIIDSSNSMSDVREAQYKLTSFLRAYSSLKENFKRGDFVILSSSASSGQRIRDTESCDFVDFKQEKYLVLRPDELPSIDPYAPIEDPNFNLTQEKVDLEIIDIRPFFNKPGKILIVLDGSGSIAEKASNGKSFFDYALNSLEKVLKQLHPQSQVNFALTDNGTTDYVYSNNYVSLSDLRKWIIEKRPLFMKEAKNQHKIYIKEKIAELSTSLNKYQADLAALRVEIKNSSSDFIRKSNLKSIKSLQESIIPSYEQFIIDYQNVLEKLVNETDFSSKGLVRKLVRVFKNEMKMITSNESNNDKVTDEGFRNILRNINKVGGTPDLAVFFTDGNVDGFKEGMGNIKDDLDKNIFFEKQTVEKMPFNIQFKPIGNSSMKEEYFLIARENDLLLKAIKSESK